MDNLSHSVSGLAAGELLHRCLKPEADPGQQRVRRRLLLFSAWAANNVPDLDFLLAPLLPRPLGYLLYHRGHTHTVLYALPQAILLMAMIWLAWPAARKLMQHSRSARSGALLAIGLGFALHLLMDYLNSYGIHPFHPFDSRWLYGDMVFIIEPLFWVVFGVPMAMMVPSRPLKIFLLAVLTGVPLFFTVQGFLSWSSLAVLVLAAALFGWFQHRARAADRRTLIGAFGVSIAFVALQAYGSAQGKRIVANTIQRSDSTVVDVSMSAFPANPLCWSFVSVERRDAAGSYALRRGILSLAPGLLPATQCAPGFSGGPFAPGVTPAIALQAQYEGRLDVLRTLKESNCHAEAWLRFVRAPWLGDSAAWDLRFGERPDNNFTTMRYEDFKNRPCPRYVPQWSFPRSDLLAPPNR